MSYMQFFMALALATIRTTAFLVICPPFSNRAIPGRIKAMLGVALGLATMHHVSAPTSTGAFLTSAVVQAFIGFGMGFVVYVLVVSLQAAGALIDLEGGFSMAQAFDPLTMTNGATVSRVYNMMALAMLFATNGYQLILLGLARSYQVAPVGAAFNWEYLATNLASASGNLLVAALEIGGPLLMILFLTDMGLGLLTRVAPALNAFALGFPLKILVTVTLVPTIMVVVPWVVAQTVDRSLNVLQGVGP